MTKLTIQECTRDISWIPAKDKLTKDELALGIQLRIADALEQIAASLRTTSNTTLKLNRLQTEVNKLKKAQPK